MTKNTRRSPEQLLAAYEEKAARLRRQLAALDDARIPKAQKLARALERFQDEHDLDSETLAAAGDYLLQLADRWADKALPSGPSLDFEGTGTEKE